ncbi:MAG: lipocalin family protein [Chitinophagales bacterium]|nr:lipocalin family protein [Chitinophagales bacterium]
MIRTLSFFSLALIFFTSCEKKRIADGTRDISQAWVVVKTEKNGADDTGNFDLKFKDYTIFFSEDGNYDETYALYGSAAIDMSGTWLFQNNATEIQLADSTQTRFFEIIELNQSELILQLLGVPDEEVRYLEPH